MLSHKAKKARFFDNTNPQHLAWLKRKLARGHRYRRKYRRGGREAHQPRHLQSRRPAMSYWWEALMVVGYHGAAGKAVVTTRREAWAAAQLAKSKANRFGGV